MDPRIPGARGLEPATKLDAASASRRHTARETLIGLACAAGVVLLFSSFVLISRYGLRTALEPADIAFVRFLVAGLILLPVFLRHGTAGLQLPQAVALAGLGAIGFPLFAYYGFERAPASHGSALIHGTLPAFSLLLAYLFSRQLPTRLGLAGAVAIGAGVVLIMWDSLSIANRSQLLGDISLLGASACWAGYGLLVGRFALPALAATAIVTTFAMVGYTPVYLAMAPGRLLSLPAGDVLMQAAFQGVLIGIVSVVLYTRVVRALGATAAALAAAFVPALTTVLAMPLLGEAPSATAVTGVLLVTLGIIVPIVLRSKIR